MGNVFDKIANGQVKLKGKTATGEKIDAFKKIATGQVKLKQNKKITSDDFKKLNIREFVNEMKETLPQNKIENKENLNVDVKPVNIREFVSKVNPSEKKVSNSQGILTTREDVYKNAKPLQKIKMLGEDAIGKLKEIGTGIGAGAMQSVNWASRAIGSTEEESKNTIDNFIREKLNQTPNSEISNTVRNSQVVGKTVGDMTQLLLASGATTPIVTGAVGNAVAGPAIGGAISGGVTGALQGYGEYKDAEDTVRQAASNAIFMGTVSPFSTVSKGAIGKIVNATPLKNNIGANVGANAVANLGSALTASRLSNVPLKDEDKQSWKESLLNAGVYTGFNLIGDVIKAIDTSKLVKAELESATKQVAQDINQKYGDILHTNSSSERAMKIEQLSQELENYRTALQQNKYLGQEKTVKAMDKVFTEIQKRLNVIDTNTTLNLGSSNIQGSSQIIPRNLPSGNMNVSQTNLSSKASFDNSNNTNSSGGVNGNLSNTEHISNEKRVQLESEIKTNKHLTIEEKNELINILEEVGLTEENSVAVREILDNVNKSFEYDVSENKYRKYLNDKTELDKSIVDTAKNSIVVNKNGKRTKEQWLSVASNLGKQIYNMSDEEIERYAYKTWQEIRPNQSQNLNRQGKRFVKFTTDEWVNAVNNSVVEARQRTKLSEQSGIDRFSIQKNIETVGKKDYNKIIEDKLTEKYGKNQVGQVFDMSVSDMMPLLNEGGFRTNDQINELRNSIISDGITSPIEIYKKDDGSYAIENGNHRLKIANELGLKNIPVKLVESWESVLDRSKNVKEMDKEMSGNDGTSNRDSIFDGESGNSFRSLPESNVLFGNGGTAEKNVGILKGKSNSNQFTSSVQNSRNNQSVKDSDKSSFFEPEKNVNEFKSSESGRPLMNFNENIVLNTDSKYTKTGLSDIEKVINDIVPVKVGKFRQKAYGIYKNRGEIIRIKQKNDIPVALHELTHHLDKQFNLSSNGDFDDELFQIAVASPNASKETLRAEGVAEFGRYYMTDPEYAERIAPKYYNEFKEKLNSNPDMKQSVEKLQEMLTNYLNQSPLNRILSHIDYGDDSANIFTKAKDRILEFKKSFRKNFFDDLDPLKQIINDITDGKKLPVDKDAYAKLRLNRGVTGRVQVALEYGITNNNGEKIGKSLKEIIEPIQNDIDGFVAYISALRAKDLETRNIESGFNLRDIDEILSEYGENETFNKASKELYEYQNQILEKTLVDSGIITKDALKAYNEANPHYVPFYRVMDKNFKQSKDSMSKSPKKIKGSTRDIINPLESIIKNTYSYYMISEKNNAYKSLFDLANEYDGTGKWFDKVPTDMTGQKVTANDIKGILDKLDLDKSDVDYNELFTTIFKPSNYQKGNIVTVMDRGKPVHYEIMDEGLYKILAQGNKRTENFITNILSSGATALRVGATHTLEFTLRNPIKDTFDAFTYSKNNFIPVVDTIIGIFNVAGKSDLYYKWLESGGSGSSYTNAQRTTLRNTLKGIMPEVYSQRKIDAILDSALHPLRTYLNLIGELSNVTEEGTRVGEFRRALKNNKTAGESALESRDITVDFSRGGESTKEANRYIAFLNANVQGLDKMFMAFKERPVATTIKGIVAFMLPAMLIAGVTEEDDRDKVPQWEKDSHWIFFINGTPVRIPKPQGVGGAFANLGESIIDYMRKKDPEVFKHFMFETMLSYMPVSDLPSLMPNALMTPFEIGANKSFFKDSKIVSQSMENRSPEYQYDEYTSTLAKQIGKAFKVSPKKVDYLIGGYFGNLGKDVATLLGLPIDIYENVTNGKKQTYATTNSVLKKIPLIKGFIANDYANPTLDNFYDNKSQALTDYTDAKFKYSDGKLSIEEEKELELLKNINSIYTSAYSKIKDKNEEKEKIENGPYTNEAKNGKLLLISKEIDNIVKKANDDAEILRKRAKLPTLKK